MKKIAFILLIAANVTAVAAPKGRGPVSIFKVPDNQCWKWACDVQPADKVIVSRGITSVFEPAVRGCCSFHSGVCGCTEGRAVCCDGSLSPGCGCD